MKHNNIYITFLFVLFILNINIYSQYNDLCNNKTSEIYKNEWDILRYDKLNKKFKVTIQEKYGNEKIFVCNIILYNNKTKEYKLLPQNIMINKDNIIYIDY